MNAPGFNSRSGYYLSEWLSATG